MNDSYYENEYLNKIWRGSNLTIFNKSLDNNKEINKYHYFDSIKNSNFKNSIENSNKRKIKKKYLKKKNNYNVFEDLDEEFNSDFEKDINENLNEIKICKEINIKNHQLIKKWNIKNILLIDKFIKKENYVCKICYKIFKNNSSLGGHFKIHNNY